MAKLILDDKEIEVPDGSNIKAACEELGIPIGCSNGFCRTCEIDVIEGYETLSELSDNEKLNELHGKKRLACQCKIKSGTVKIKF
jgi:ferredoxin